MKILHASNDKVEFSKQVICSNYYEKDWTDIIRPLRNKSELISIAKAIIDNPYVGYSQVYRHTLFYNTNFDNLKNVKQKLYCDCSSFVETCVVWAKIITSYQGVVTRDMLNKFMYNGSFGFYHYKNKQQLKDGDIILKQGSHCGIICDCEDSDYEQTIPVIKTNKAMVRVGSLRVRKTPNGEHIKSLFYGNVVQIVETNGSWSHIIYKDIDGWVSSNFLTAVN